MGLVKQKWSMVLRSAEVAALLAPGAALRAPTNPPVPTLCDGTSPYHNPKPQRKDERCGTCETLFVRCGNRCSGRLRHSLTGRDCRTRERASER
jgi:hypothetical protein